MRIDSVTGFQTATGDVALLVDGENLPPAHAANLLGLARKGGQLRVARVYGDGTHLGDWRAKPGFKVIATGERPQAADIQIAIDAVAMAHADGIRSFVIASDDRDFAALACHLREAGCSVLGAGTAKAPAELREAFSRFHDLTASDQGIPEGVRKQHAPQRSKLRDAVVACILEKGNPPNEMRLAQLGQMLRKKDQSFGPGKLRKHLENELSAVCKLVGEASDFRVILLQPPTP